MWTPGDGFDGCLVFAPLESGLGIQLIPDHEFVVVTARGQLLIFGVPFEAADLLLMADELGSPHIGLADVAVVDEAVP